MTDAPYVPTDATEDKPEGAEGLTYVRDLGEGIEGWSVETAEWLTSGAWTRADANRLVWWRRVPDEGDAIEEAAQWIRGMCHSAQEHAALTLGPSVIAHGIELAERLDAALVAIERAA